MIRWGTMQRTLKEGRVDEAQSYGGGDGYDSGGVEWKRRIFLCSRYLRSRQRREERRMERRDREEEKGI